ncbi:MAG TPA: ABC transporter substrate-binding protein [Planctomycetota bacterium]|nr:ABC transporter substrate-binding protein [Planctomycetota bacterium]
MRERSIVWDILVVFLLGALVLINGIALMQNKRIEAQNLTVLLRERRNQSVEMPSRSETNSSRNASPAPVNDGTHSPSYFDGSTLPHWVRGDENADDGDAVIINEVAEPNSLNPTVDNDATASDLFNRANDRLADHAFDDLNYWKPMLARAWEKGMLCRGLAAKKNAKDLAAKLNAAFTPEQLKTLKVQKIEAESDDVLRIELFDASGDYRDPVLKTLGDGAIEPQHWLYIAFEGDTFADGTKLNAASVAARARDAIEKSGFKGRFLGNWERESSAVVQLVGDSAAAESALRKMLDSGSAMGNVTDPKSPTGKATRKVLTLDLIEHYTFEEKPVFTYYLRNDVRWHDGEPFTGKDVVFSFNAMMNPKVEAASLRNYYQDCESVTLVNNDPFTVRYVWKKPYFLSFNFSNEIPIFPEHIYHFTDPEQFNESAKNEQVIGTGPYKFDKWEHKQQIIFVRNEDYYGHKPHLLRTIYKFIQDRTVSLSMLEKGDLDVHGLTKPQAKQKENDEEFKKRFNIEISLADHFSFVGWNMRRDLFKSEKTRRALTMLIDRKTIVDSIMKGYAAQLDVPTHPSSPVCPDNPERLRIPFSIEGAKKLLAEDGWKLGGDNVLAKEIDGKRLPFSFTLQLSSGSPEAESMANLMKDTMAQAGIVMNIKTLEWSVLVQNMERLNFDAVISGWQVGTDDDPYQLFHSSQTGEKASNFCGYVDKVTDHLIEEGRRELDASKRNPMFKQVYERIAQAQPYTVLFVTKRTVAYDKRLHNVVYKLNGPEIQRWWVPKSMQKRN